MKSMTAAKVSYHKEHERRKEMFKNCRDNVYFRKYLPTSRGGDHLPHTKDDKQYYIISLCTECSLRRLQNVSIDSDGAATFLLIIKRWLVFYNHINGWQHHAFMLFHGNKDSMEVGLRHFLYVVALNTR